MNGAHVLGPVSAPARRRAAHVGALLATGALVTGCSGDPTSTTGGGSAPVNAATSSAPSSSPAPASPTEASASPTPTSYLPVPAGIELTDPGGALRVGQRATVAWRPQSRSRTVGVLDVKVTRMESARFKDSFEGWQLDAATRATTPYFVRATLTNVGETDLGRRRVPLYLVDETDALVESSTFASRFEPCPSTPLPRRFAPGAPQRVCLVYLAPDQG